MIKTEIERNAHKIQQYLERYEISSAFEIEKALSLQRQQILLALGWLAKENKIFFYGKAKDSQIALVYPN